MKQNAEVEVEKLIAEAKDKIDAIYQDYQTKNEIKMHEVIKSKKDLDALLSLDEEEYVSPYVPQINDYVRDETFNVTGSVIRLKGDNAIILTSQGLTLTCKINDLTKISSKAPKEKKQFTPSYKLEKKVPLECNIVGFHIEEGLREVDKYLDDAITAHYKEVRIIHGSGTGKLRSAVQEYLKKRKDVKSFRLGGLGEGGVGATIVYF
jgi:DNA mismatch repair protein MutS2